MSHFAFCAKFWEFQWNLVRCPILIDEFTLKMFFPSLKVLEVMGALATTVFEVESS